jgi:hypothetical protein
MTNKHITDIATTFLTSARKWKNGTVIVTLGENGMVNAINGRGGFIHSELGPINGREELHELYEEMVRLMGDFKVKNVKTRITVQPSAATLSNRLEKIMARNDARNAQ